MTMMPGYLSGLRPATRIALMGAWLLLALLAPPARAQSDAPTTMTLTSDLAAAEGGNTVTLTATLNNPVPPGDPETVELTVTGSAGGSGVDYSLSGTTLRFAPGDTEATLSLMIIDDNIVEGTETIILTVTTTSRFSLTASPLTLSVADNDDPGMVFDPSPERASLILTEGDDGSYTIVLTAQPTASVIITPASSDTDAASVSGPLTFTTGNWDTAQTVVINALDDADGQGEIILIMHLITTVAAGYDAFLPPLFALAINDDDAPTMLTLTNDITPAEGGGTVTVTATLDKAAPQGGVEVTLIPTGTAQGGSVDYALSPRTLTIAEGDSAATATITVVDDLADDDAETIILAAESRTFPLLTATSLTLVITDNDDPPPVTFSLTGQPEPVREGRDATLTITLSQDAPAGGLPFTVTANFSSTADRADTGTVPTMIRIREGTRTGTLTIPIAHDRVAENNEIFTVSIATSVMGWMPEATGADTAQITIADATRFLRFDRARYEVVEGLGLVLSVERIGGVGDTLRFTVVTANGSATAPDDFAGGEYPGRFAVDAAFTTINIPTVADAIDEGVMETFTVAFGTGGDPGYITGAPVTVTLVDNDTAGVAVTPGFALLTEGDSNTYTVVLSSQPTAGVTVTPGSDSAAVTVSTSRTDNTLRFTADNWNARQTVTMTAGQDADTNDESGISIRNTVTSRDASYNGFSSPPLRVHVNDDDRPGVSFSVDRLLPVAEGASVSYTLVLNTEPNASVTITPASVSPAVRVSGPLIFTTENWNRAQSVTVTGEQDPDGNDEINILITHTATSSDNGYNGIGLRQVAIRVNDDEVIGAAVSPTTLAMTEGDITSYTVVLTSQPTATVTVTPDSDNAAVGVSGPLIFTTENWNRAQSVTVTGEQDPDTEDETAAIRHTVNSADRDYGNFRIVPVTVTVDDDEGVMIPITEALTVQEEGAPIIYPVTLGGNSPPAAAVQIRLVSTNPNVVMVSPEILTFTPDNWDTPQSVTVTITGSGEVDITHTTVSSDRNYDKLVLDPVVVVVAPRGLSEDAVSLALLPDLSRVLADTAVGAVARRIQQVVEDKASGSDPGSTPSATLGGQSSLGALLKTHAPALARGRLDPATLLGNSTFVLPLHSAFAGQAEGGALGRAVLTLWGSGSYRNLSGGGKNDRQLDWDGETFSAQLGLDARLHSDWLLGVAGSWGRSSVDYQDRIASDTGRQGYRLTLIGIHPYVSWTPEAFGDRGLNLWLSGGYSWGELGMDHRLGRVTSDVDGRLVAGGGSIRLWKRAYSVLRFRVEGQQARTEAEGNPERDLARHSVTTDIVRALVEGEHTMTLANGANLTPALTLGLRHDGGDGRRGGGMDLAGSLRYRLTPGWQAGGGIEAFVGRHGYREWGLWGLVHWAHRGDGPGWSFSLRPRYGRQASSTIGIGERLWERTGAAGPDSMGSAATSPAGRLDLRLGYDLVRAGLGRFIPYSELHLGAQTRRYRLGLQWLPGGQWDVDLAGWREEHRGAGTPGGARRDHSILLQGRKRY